MKHKIFAKARGAGPITFRIERDAEPYAVLTMAQVERLRERGTFAKFIARARREFARRCSSRIVLPDCNGHTVPGIAPVTVGAKLAGHEFNGIKNYEITHRAFDAARNEFTFYTYYRPES